MNRAIALSSRAGVVDWRAVVWAGLIGGAIYLVLQFVGAPLLTTVVPFTAPVLTVDAPWVWFHMSAAIVLGREVLTAPDTFSLTVFVVALALHFVLALMYSAMLALLLYRWHGPRASWNKGAVLAIGAGFGVVLYLLNYRVFTIWFPWFADLRHGITIANNVLFGAVTAIAYVALVQYHHAKRPPQAGGRS